MGFESVKDEKVRKLAETLKSTGIVASEMEAINMAKDMSSTVDKVQKGYDGVEDEESKEQSGTQGAAADPKQQFNIPGSQPKKTSEETTVPKQEENSAGNISQPSQTSQSEGSEHSEHNAFNTSKDQAKDVFKQQEDLLKSSYKEDLDTTKTVEELMDEDAGKVYAGSRDKVNVSKPETTVSAGASEEKETKPSTNVEEQALADTQTSQPEQAEDDDSDDSDSDDEMSEEERKKKIDDMPESKIDLSDTFNFGNR